MVGALIGLGEGGEEGMEVGATAGAEAASDGVDVFDGGGGVGRPRGAPERRRRRADPARAPLGDPAP